MLFSILSLEYLPAPHIWFFGLWSIAFFILAISSPRTLIKLASFNFAIFMFFFAIAESYLVFQHDNSDKKNKYRWENVFNYEGHPIFGWREIPNSQRTGRKFRTRDNSLIYEASITIDRNGQRIAPTFIPPPNSTGESALFFGGSFTFGEGVNNDQTMPYVFGTLTKGRFKIYNFGMGGYGPHQMLAAIEHGLVNSIVEVRPRYIIYQGIIDHIKRVSHLNRGGGPHYRLSKTGETLYTENPQECNPTHEYCLWKPVKQNLKKSLLLNSIWFHQVTHREIKLFLNIVERSKTLLQERYPEAEFHVIFWDKPNSSISEGIEGGLREKNFNVHFVQDIIPDYWENWETYHFVDDWHPSAQAHQRIAQYVVTNIVGPHTEVVSNYPPSHLSAKIQ